MKSFSRRKFICGALGAASLGVLVPTISQSEISEEIQLEKLTLELERLPKSFEDYRIGFLSDIHFGSWLPTETVESAAKLLKEAKVDLLLLGGDYLWLHDKWLDRLFPEARNSKIQKSPIEKRRDLIYFTLAQALKSITPKDGTYAVMGNHDNWDAYSACLTQFNSHGIRVLINEGLSIRRGKDSLRVFGLDDIWTGIPSLETEHRSLQKNECRVLLTHNPDLYTKILEQLDFEFDLGLAGHTHGGQVKLPLTGALVHNIYDMRFFEGLQKNVRVPIYTSRGIGAVELPVRVNCPPEAVVLELKRA